MALGNANSSAQSRGKNKPVMVKRTKELFLAKDYHPLSGSLLVPSGPPCNLHPGLVTQAYYHSAGSAGGYTTGTHVFTQKRAHTDFYLPDGNYKVTHDGSAYKGITIANGRIAIIENCK